MVIYIGPAGVPISAKERSTIGGIQRCAELGLNAMECEFVRGVNMGKDLAEKIKDIAKENNVRLSIHAPYYINLLSEKKEIVAASRQRIFDSADRGERMGADAIAIHAAYYGSLSSEQATENLCEQFSIILDKMKSAGIKNVKLGVETMAKESQWGTLEEVLELHKRVKSVVPYIDWAHLFARGHSKIDYAFILDKLKKAGIKHINSHFEGMKFDPKTKRHKDVHVPIGEPPFEPLAKELVKRKIDITLVCESPLLEEDALKMKSILEKCGHKPN